MLFDYLFIFAAITVVIALFTSGWKYTLIHLLPGAGCFALGYGLTVLMRGNTIFIGAMVVGVFLFIRGIYLLITDPESD